MPRSGGLRIWLSTLAIALTVYVVSLAPGPLWQDSGLAQVRVLQRDLFGELGLALSHPLYYLLALAAQWLPVGNPAWRTGLVAAVAGAVTVANVALLLRLLTGRAMPAVTGALAVGVAHTFWQHAAMPEVYTVSTALLTAELLCLAAWCVTGQARWIVLLFLANGLGISNHLLALLSLVCYGLLVAYLWLRGRVPGRALLWSGVAWVLGASIYLALIVVTLARGAGLQETIHSALFGDFARNVLNVRLGWHLIRNSVMYLGLNFPTPLALLAPLGIWAWRSDRFRVARVALLGLLTIHLLYAVRYDVPDQYTFFIPSIVLIGVLIGLGAAVLCGGGGRALQTAVIAAAILPVGVYAALPEFAHSAGLKIGVTRQVPYRDEYRYFLQPWKTGDDGAMRFALATRDALPAGAVLLADSTTVRPIHYLQLTGQWSEQVKVVPPSCGSRGIDLASEALRRTAAEGRLYVVSNVAPYCPDWVLKSAALVPHGPVYHVRPRIAATQQGE